MDCEAREVFSSKTLTKTEPVGLSFNQDNTMPVCIRDYPPGLCCGCLLLGLIIFRTFTRAEATSIKGPLSVPLEGRGWIGKYRKIAYFQMLYFMLGAERMNYLTQLPCMHNS